MDHDRRIAALEDRVAFLEGRIDNLERALFEGVQILPAWGLTTSEARVFGCLVKRDVATKEAVLAALYTDLGRDEAAPKIVDVFICKIRKKLRPFGVEIRTVWGSGFSLTDRVRFLPVAA